MYRALGVLGKCKSNGSGARRYIISREEENSLLFRTSWLPRTLGTMSVNCRVLQLEFKISTRSKL